jgi:hypothetical protein
MKYLINILLGFILIASITGCGVKKDESKKENGKTTSSEVPVSKSGEQTPGKTELKTKTGKTFTVIIEPQSGKVSDIYVYGTGFAKFLDTVYINDAFLYENAVLADLDGNGFEELYIITKSKGTDAYLNLSGVVSSKDTSYFPVFIQNIEDNDLKQGNKFEGYMGHDKFTFEKDRILREFPVYKETDTLGKPSGGIRKVFYKLSAVDSTWQLKIEEDKK